MEINITDRYTEVYANGGGNWITQSYPTNFHQFYRRKMLTADEKIEDFREVTDAEKTALETADAQWEEPERLFINQWNALCETYGTYNEETGFFELNGLTDIAYEEALLIYKKSVIYSSTYKSLYAHKSLHMRTLLPIITFGSNEDLDAMFQYSYKLVTIRLISGYTSLSIKLSTFQSIFYNCFDLREVYGIFDVSTYKHTEIKPCVGCKSLEGIYIFNLKNDLNIADSPLLRIDCLEYIINNAINTSPITITVHPDIFAKITDEENAEWHPLLALAQEKNITFATK